MGYIGLCGQNKNESLKFVIQKGYKLLENNRRNNIYIKCNSFKNKKISYMKRGIVKTFPNNPG